MVSARKARAAVAMEQALKHLGLPIDRLGQQPQCLGQNVCL
jgi:hypothetical protein